MRKNKYKPAPLLCWDIFMDGIRKEKACSEIPIGGFQKQSLIDFPGNVSAVIFTCGCNFRCIYCHNPELVYSKLISKNSKIKCADFFSWLTKNKGLLDAVVITGGEPTLHASLPGFIQEIKKLSLKVKLDTNGTNPEMLKQLIVSKQINYVAMDVKAPLNLTKYKKVAADNFNDTLLEKVTNSIKILNKRLVDYEFRTTVDNSLSIEDFKSIASEISGKYYIQNRIDHNNSTSISSNHFSQSDLDLLRINQKSGLEVFIRN